MLFRSVKARGERLREMSRFLPQPLCVLQWSGEPDALESFTGTLPHEVECIIGLSENPLKVYRYMRVSLPKGMPGGVLFEGFLVH